MTRVTRDMFARILEWLRGADNWIGRGSHEVDGESYYMRVGGAAKLAAEHFWDDVGHGGGGDTEFWRVDDALLRLWREQGGYTIEF